LGNGKHIMAIKVTTCLSQLLLGLQVANVDRPYCSTLKNFLQIKHIWTSPPLIPSMTGDCDMKIKVMASVTHYRFRFYLKCCKIRLRWIDELEQTHHVPFSYTLLLSLRVTCIYSNYCKSHACMHVRARAHTHTNTNKNPQLLELQKC
jgi:hypothetical protein